MGALSVVKNLIGVSNGADALEAELEAAKAAGSAAYTEIELLKVRKINADDFKAVEAIDREIAEQHWLIAKAVKAIPEIEHRLASAKAMARAAQLRELKAPFEPAMRAYLAKAGEVMELFNAMVAVKDKLAHNTFSVEAQALELPPHINGNCLLAADLLAQFKANWINIENRRAKAPSRISTPPTPPVRPLPADRRAQEFDSSAICLRPSVLASCSP